MPKICLELPAHLRTLAGIREHEIALDVAAPLHAPARSPSIAAVLDVLESAYPMLLGTIRDHATGERRAFLRFFACQQDLSLQPIDSPLPPAVADGREPLIILGAVAGGSGLSDWKTSGPRRVYAAPYLIEASPFTRLAVQPLSGSGRKRHRGDRAHMNLALGSAS